MFDQIFSVRDDEVNQRFSMVSNSCWFFILNCSSIPFILFRSYDVSPRSSCNRLVLKSPRSTIFEHFVQIFSINFGNAVKNSLFWFGGRYIVEARVQVGHSKSAFYSW